MSYATSNSFSHLRPDLSLCVGFAHLRNIFGKFGSHFVHLQNIIAFIFITMSSKEKMMSIELKREVQVDEDVRA